MKTITLLLFASLALGARAAEYRITVTNVGPQPLSPIFYSAGTSAFDIFNVGGTASLGIKGIAEGGDTTAMLAIAAGAGSAVGTYGVLGASPLAPGPAYTTTFTADAAHPYFSFAAMLGKTNDGFIGEGVSSLGLRLDGGDLDLTVLGSRAWDAGTELNTQSAADLAFLGGSGNPQEDPANALVRVHGGVIDGLGEFAQMPAWQLSTSLARIQVQAVPEPASFAALGVGALALLRRRGRRN